MGKNSTTDDAAGGRKVFTRHPEGRDEFNLAEFPLAVLTDKTPGGVKTVEWEDEITDRATGLEVKRKVIVTGSDAYGLPKAPDADVLFALIQLTKQVNNFTSRDVRFSRYELLRVLDWRDEGKSYRRLEESLNRWAGTSIYFSAWRDKETETWLSETFHILDNVKLVSVDRRRRLKARGREDLAYSSISWNQTVFRNLQAGYVCPVDLDTYFSLRWSISKRIFRYLGKHFRLRGQGDLTFDLKTFAFEKIGISRSYTDAGQVKKELSRALEELEQVGFLKPLPREERFTKVGRGEWIITLTRASRGDSEVPGPGPTDPAAEPVGPGPESALTARGVTPAVAAELVRSFGREDVERQAEVHDWLVARRDRRVSKSAAGYLVESIRRGYAPPQGFVPRSAVNAAATAPVVPIPGAQQSRAADEVDDEEARVEAVWDSLTPIEQQIVRNEALQQGNAFLVAQYRRTRGTNPQAEVGYLKALIHDQVRRTRLADNAPAAEPQAEPPRAAPPGVMAGARRGGRSS